MWGGGTVGVHPLHIHFFNVIFPQYRSNFTYFPSGLKRLYTVVGLCPNQNMNMNTAGVDNHLTLEDVLISKEVYTGTGPYPRGTAPYL